MEHPENERLHYMDNVRALAMTLGLFFHAALAYSPSISAIWLTANNDTSTTIDAIFSFSHLFRMPLFFLIAGFFALMLIEKRGIRGFLQHRAKRILLPFIVFLPIVSALVIWSVFWATQAIENPSNILIYIKNVMENPEQADKKLSTMHLWFLLNLIFFSLLLAALKKFHFFESKAFGLVANTKFLIFVFPLLITPALASQVYPFPPPDKPYPQLWSFGFFGLFFFVGSVFYFKPSIIEAMRSYVPAFLIISLIAQAILFSNPMDAMSIEAAEKLIANGPEFSLKQLTMGSLEAIAATYMTLTCIVLGKQCLNTSNRVLRFISNSSYWVYIIHIPILFYIQFHLLDIHWNPWLEFAISSLGTFALCLVSYRLFVSWTFIGWMLNGRKKKQPIVSKEEQVVA